MESVYVRLVAMNGTSAEVTMQVDDNRAELVLQEPALRSFAIAPEEGPSRLLGDSATSTACFVRSFDPEEPGTRIFHGDMRLRSRLARTLTEQPALLRYDDERGWVLSWQLSAASL